MVSDQSVVSVYECVSVYGYLRMDGMCELIYVYGCVSICGYRSLGVNDCMGVGMCDSV